MIAIPKLDEKREKLLWEIGFLAVYAVLLTQYFINTTVIHLEIPYLIPKIPSYRMWIRLFAITFVVLKTARDEKFSWKELIFAAIMLISFGRCAQVAGYMELVDLAVLIIGARNVSYKKILGLYCGVSGVLIVGTMWLCFAGVIEDWVFYKTLIAKHSFGFMYPNEFGAHVFFWLLAYSALRREKITYVELAVFVAMAVGLMKYCHARTNVICIILIVVGMVFCKLVKRLDQEAHEKWLRVVRMLLAFVPAFVCIGMIALAWCYDPANGFLVNLDLKVFNHRLELGRNAFNNYGIKLFGQYVEMIGVSLPWTVQPEYNFLDCSYLMILVRYGLAGFAVIGAALAVILRKLYQRKDMVLIGLIALCGIQCVMEHHLHEIAYNPILLLVLAAFPYSVSEKEQQQTQ